MLIIYINKWGFQAESLFGHKIVDRYVMTTSLLWPIGAENVVDDMIGWKT